MPASRKIAANLLRITAVLVAAGAAAIWKRFIPTPDEKLEITEQTLQELSKLRNRKKYVDMPGAIYNGMRPEGSRLLAEEQLDGLIDRLTAALPSTPSKKFVLLEFAKTTAGFEPIDTEDREQLLRYLTEIMDIVGVASSDGQLNRWMYGPILGPLADRFARPEPRGSKLLKNK